MSPPRRTDRCTLACVLRLSTQGYFALQRVSPPRLHVLPPAHKGTMITGLPAVAVPAEPTKCDESRLAGCPGTHPAPKYDENRLAGCPFQPL